MITKEEILKLNEVIQKINSFTSETERNEYLQNIVEDVDLFLNTLKTINKNKLKTIKTNKNHIIKNTNYTQEEVMKIFEENNLDIIVEKYTKQDLTDMYLTFYSSKPLSSYDKMRIAQTIYHYIYKLNRTNSLLEQN